MQHFLGLSGKIYLLNFNEINLIFLFNIILYFYNYIDIIINSFYSQYHIMILNIIVPIFPLLKQEENIKFPNGPHILPQWLNYPVRIYNDLNTQRNFIGSDNKKRSIIYQWVNLITGKIYIGSTSNGSTRLLSYFTPSVLRKNYPIYNNINYYGIHNFFLAIIEDLGINHGDKEFLLFREQHYLNIVFKDFPFQTMNLSKIAGSNKGYKHKLEFKLNRLSYFNPMYGRIKSNEFLYMQYRNKKGIFNSAYGKIKSPETIEKITKFVYVYNTLDMSYIGKYSTVNCSKYFKMGKDTLTKYIKNKLLFKDNIFSREKLH